MVLLDRWHGVAKPYPRCCFSTTTRSGPPTTLLQEDGIEGLASFGHESGTCRLAAEQQDKLKAWIAEALPRSTCAVGAWIARERGIEYQTRSGLTSPLLHRLGMEHRKPKAVSRKLDLAKQAAFIKTCMKTS